MTQLSSRTRACLVAALIVLAAQLARAAEHFGQVTFTGAPVPGATVTARQGDRRISATTDAQGVYRFAELAEGMWTITVDMLGFEAAQQELTVSSSTPTPLSIPLMLRSFDDITRAASTVRADAVTSAPLAPVAPPRTQAASAPPPPPADDAQGGDAADGLLINGSVNNGAASPFAQAAAFGNNRTNRRSLYNGTLGAVFGNSAFDSRSFSFAGQQTPKQAYSDVQFLSAFGGPWRIPGMRNAANVFVGYQKNIDHTAATESRLVPTARERGGDFSQSRDAFGRPVTLTDPSTGLAFTANSLPASRLSPAALALLAYYPLPNLDAGGYQAALLNATNQDNVQARFAQNLNNRNSLTGTFALQRNQIDTTSLLGFADNAGTSNLDATAIWSRRFSPFFSTRLRYQFTRTTAHVTPFFAGRTNVSGAAGITGNDQDTANWGPPALTFSSGLLPLSDGQYAQNTGNSHGWLGEALSYRGRHNLTMGAGLKRNAYDALGQQNGRGTFAFTGAASGSDVADFLLGLPHSSTIAFGNADKRLRSWSYEAYFTDDWRVSPGLTINAGVRWEFEAPMRELGGRLSNLDIAPGFAAAAVVTPGKTGPLTRQDYGDTLLKADRRGVQPRVGIAWRPVAGSSLVVRAGYGIYRNTNTYQPLALLMAQQPPYSTALSVETSAAAPLTLANGFVRSTTSAPTTFAIDPDFRVGDAQNWQAILQRDLPASMTMSVGYLGAYGRNLMQEILPNTYPAGAVNPCAACPAGFAYLTSNGSSMRNAGQFMLRRRLRNGLTASAQYTLAKSADDAGAFTGAALTGAAIAQDWRDVDGERAPSNFDQRHQLVAQVQYTTGVGVAGGGLLTGKKGALVKGWTVASQITAGSGLPLTPIVLSSVANTGVTGTLRGSLTGLADSPVDGRYMNPAAYTLPAAGQWGNAGRNSITGPGQFAMTMGVARSFPWGDRMNLDWRIDASNVLNRVTYSAVNTVVGSSQFGLPTRANPMRKIQSTLRLRF